MTQFAIKPVRQKHGSKGPWILTDHHRAQMWALCAVRRGHGIKQLMRFSKLDEAKNSLTAAQRAYEGLRDRYQLGKRMEKRS